MSWEWRKIYSYEPHEQHIMNFDTLVIGGGLSGLLCAIRLQKAGKRTAIVSSGQNALHFSSGTFSLLHSTPDGTPVDTPLDALDALEDGHPYRKIGKERMERLIAEIPGLLQDCGIPVHGQGTRNSYYLSPMGTWKKAWLALDDIQLFPDKSGLQDAEVLLVNFPGYLDFNTAFIEEGLSRSSARVRTETLSVPELDVLRANPSEMRSIGIARIVDREAVRSGIVDAIRGISKGEDTVVLPAVFGLDDPAIPGAIRAALGLRTLLVSPMPPSVPGIRTQKLLKKAFLAAGGRMLEGDTVVHVTLDGQKVSALYTENLGDTPLTADNYILASGSFFSRGLHATPGRIEEPLMGLDVIAVPGRENWYDKDFFGRHAYLGFGIGTDKDFHPMKDGMTVHNLWAAGAVLGGANTLAEGCGAGCAILTAMAVANHIISGK